MGLFQKEIQIVEKRKGNTISEHNDFHNKNYLNGYDAIRESLMKLIH